MGLANVKVGEVFKVIKTLFELILAPPTCTKGSVAGIIVVLVGDGVGVGGIGIVDRQVEGWPVQSQFY